MRKDRSQSSQPVEYKYTSISNTRTNLRIREQTRTIFPTSSDLISLSQRTDFAPLMVAILRMVSAGRVVGSQVPFENPSCPLLIKEAKYISSTAVLTKD